MLFHVSFVPVAFSLDLVIDVTSDLYSVAVVLIFLHFVVKVSTIEVVLSQNVELADLVSGRSIFLLEAGFALVKVFIQAKSFTLFFYDFFLRLLFRGLREVLVELVGLEVVTLRWREIQRS